MEKGATLRKSSGYTSEVALRYAVTDLAMLQDKYEIRAYNLSYKFHTLQSLVA